jgi:hypothetical protein
VRETRNRRWISGGAPLVDLKAVLHAGKLRNNRDLDRAAMADFALA